ncbi:MAG: SDR family oxidoreductase [Bacteroidia bacterium]|nr:SDR family oxidoreductase [Bacteroidia bacterium]MCZ2278281.1 SDR family oxidoreductase [Bacteroidia bacterium]
MKDKVVIITGGSSGIGKACALEFARKGSKVIINGRNETTLKQAAYEISQLQADVLAVKADIRSESDCKRLIDEGIKKFGRIDVLINNAGISMRAAFDETSPEVLKQLMATNFWGAVYCTYYAIPYLLASKGSVVGISSIAGKAGLPGRTGYSASKFALEGFLESLRTENLNRGLHVLVASPGFTASNIRNNSLSKSGSPQGESPRNEQKMMSAEEVATALYRAVVNRKRDLILTTEGKLAVCLKKFFPAWLDKILFRKMSREPGSPF